MTKLNAKKIRSDIRSLVRYEQTITNAEISRTLGISPALVSYHAKKMWFDPPRLKQRRSCLNCGRRITKHNTSHMCKRCRFVSYAYEFRCSNCRKINVVYGSTATRRRSQEKRTPKGYQYCDRSCSSKHRMKRYWTLKRLTEDPLSYYNV